MDTVREKFNIPDGLEQDENFNAVPDSRPTSGPERISPPQSTIISPQIRTWEVRMDIESGPAAIPASIVSEVRTDITPTIPPMSLDFVTQGVVTLEQAQSLFDVYCHRLDHYLYRILGDSISLKRIRGNSPLLLGAVCTVGALHSKSLGFLFEKCYHRFQELCATQTIAKESNLDDIRGLCIGAFWLHDISWTLVSQAVRIATQMQMHRGLQKSLRGDKQAYLQTRVYYLVYVCDHHFSIAYGQYGLEVS